MATYNFENKSITSDSFKTTVITNGVEQVFTSSDYTASTPLTSTLYTQNDIHQYANGRIIDITGNSQETFAGRGLTCEYSIKVIGSPEMFTGEAQMGADAAIASIVGVLLQSGDDRNFVSPNPLDGISPTQIVSNMTSSWQSSFSPEMPPIVELSDIPIALGKIIAFGQAVEIADLAEQAKRAATLTLEQTETKIKNNINANVAQFGDAFNTNDATSAPPATDLIQGNYTTPKSTLYNLYYENQDSLLAHQRNIG